MSATREAASRSASIGSAIQAYMDVFVLMQASAISHWLMLDLSFAEARALILIAAWGEVTVTQLARLLHVGKPTASTLAQRLVERGLIGRTEHELDRRRTILRLSPEGRVISEGRQKERMRQWRAWLRRLEDGDVAALARGLEALRRVVRADLRREDRPTPGRGAARPGA
jgi:DNA-binding MarR family transcriptional regulator